MTLKPARTTLLPLSAVFMTFCCLLVGCTTDTSPAAVADTIFVGGHILTINPVGETPGLAIRNGVIVATGDTAVVMALKGDTTQVVDLAGKTLMPGFVEPHLHIAQTATNLQLVQCGSELPGGLAVANVLAALKQAVGSITPPNWLVGNGFDPSRTTPASINLPAVPD